MPPKKNANKAAAAAAEPAPAPPSAPAGPTAAAAIPGTMTSQPKAVPNTKISTGGAQNWDKVLANIYDHYVNNTPQRTKLIDVFMVFLVAVGALQFLYCVLAGNYVRLGPFCDFEGVGLVLLKRPWGHSWKSMDLGELGTRNAS